MINFSLKITLFYIVTLGFSLNPNLYGQNTSPTGAIESGTLSTVNFKLRKSQGSGLKPNVHRGLLDKAGNLWFATTGEGVYKYDGKIFTQFTTANGLNSNIVYCMLESKNGDIWFGTEDGATRFDGKQFEKVEIPGRNEKVNDARKSPDKNFVNKNAVWSMMQDKDGKIWFGASTGMYVYDGKTFTEFFENNKISNNDNLHLKMTESIFQDKSRNIWFGSYVSEGISVFDGKSLRRLYPNVRQKSFGYVRVMSILEDRNGLLWFGTADGAYRYDGKALTNFGQDAGIDWVYNMLEDKSGNIWFATEESIAEPDGVGGAWRYNGTTFSKFTTKEGLVHNGVFSFVEDASGGIWIGTRKLGLSKFDGKMFTTYSE